MLTRHRQYLADTLWLSGHEEKDGRPYTSAPALGLGLAGALLAELVMHRKLDCTPRGTLRLTDQSRIPIHDDPLADHIRHEIVNELSKLPDDRADHVAEWLNSRSERADGWVTRRLVAQGVIEPVEYRKLFKTEIRHCVVELGDGAAPAANLRGRLERGEALKEHQLAFAGFAIAMGLNKVVLRDTSESAQRYLMGLMQNLRQPLRCLIAETDAAVGQAVLTHRR